MLQVLAGDLNIEPYDLAFRLILSTAKLTDSCTETTLSTNECIHNSYTPDAIKAGQPEGKRIDYILYRPGKMYLTEIIKHTLPLASTIPVNKKISYSDHEAVLTIFRIKHADDDRPHNADEPDICEFINHITPLQESIQVCKDNLIELKSNRNLYLIMALVTLFLLCWVIDIVPSFSLKIVYTLLKLALSGILLYFIFMATLWHAMEWNGVLAGKLAMEMALDNLLSRQQDTIRKC